LSRLSRRPINLTLHLKDSSQEWRRVVLRGNTGASGNIEWNINGSTQGSTSQNNFFRSLGRRPSLTARGQPVSANGQSYLVAYLLAGKAIDMASLLQAALTKSPLAVEILTPETTLRLSLLDIQAIAGIEDVRVFDMNEEIAQSQDAAKKLANLIKAMAEASAPRPDKK
jgi:hypothetical protein